jgi:acyl-CoA thioesterase-1
MRKPVLRSAPLLLIAVATLLGCNRGGTPAPAPAAPAASTVAPLSAAPAPGETLPRVVFLGDSLSAGLGVAEEEAYPAILAGLLAERGRPVHLVNAGVSGDTTAGGLARLDWVLRQHPAVLVVELGANDGLRGQPLEGVESNLREILRRAKESGAQVLLVGMKIPPNYGQDYTDRFAAIYPRLAKEVGVELVPFLLADVAADPKLNQADGIHPTAEGHKIVARTVLPYLERVLDKALGKPVSKTPQAPFQAPP